MALDYNQFAGSLLSSLGSGLMSAGSGGWNNFAPGFIQGQQMYTQNRNDMLDRQQRAKLQALQEEQIRLALEQQRTANQDKVKRQQDWEKLTGGFMSPNGMSQAQFGGAPMQPGLMSQDFTPEQMSFLRALPADQGMGIVAEQMFKQTDPVKWDIEKIREGNQDVTYRINPYTGERERLGAGSAFAPQQPSEPKIDYITLVGPDNKPITVNKYDPRAQQLIDRGYTVRPMSIFPGVPSGYQVDPNNPTGLTFVPGGPEDPSVKASSAKPTESEQKTEQLATRAEQQLPTVVQNWDALSDPKSQAASAFLPDVASNFLTSPEYQQANNALTDIVSSYLYSVSGAQAPESEVQRLLATVRPKIGESQQSKADKLTRIQEMVNSISLKRKAGAAPISSAPAGVVDTLPPGFE